MEIKGTVHCMFEQSGTFRDEFRKLGYKAFDYDIQNEFKKTDYVIDLFGEIEKGYNGEPSIFDGINSDGLIIAFFPCIYFSCVQMSAYTCHYQNYRNLQGKKLFDTIIERIKKREQFYITLYKLVAICEIRNIRLIVENPSSMPQYLLFPENFYKKPTFIDRDRTRRGDNYKKPTAYWFFQCSPTHGRTYQTPRGGVKRIVHSRDGKHAGICSTERSTISHDYARNFICDFILGKEQIGTELDLFYKQEYGE